MKIEALVVEEKNAPFVKEELALEQPGPGEALVRVVASGVCHTDAITQAGDMPLPLPGVLGHEGSGVVEAVGEGVTSVAAGDHVIMGWPTAGSAATAAAASTGTVPCSAPPWPVADGSSDRRPAPPPTRGPTGPHSPVTSSDSPPSPPTL